MILWLEAIRGDVWLDSFKLDSITIYLYLTNKPNMAITFLI